MPAPRKSAFGLVHELAAQGFSDYAIARLIGVPRPTVHRWRHRSVAPGTLTQSARDIWQPPNPQVYCYLLGVYLGDGHVIHRSPAAWTLRVANDQRYVSISREILDAMVVTFPGRRATQFPASNGASDVLQISHPAIGMAFPQHGRGRKHLRPIKLTDWQRELTRSHPGALIRGLIHSDGCRAKNCFRTKLPSGRVAEYSYIRYFFTNLSADIRQIFIDHCELLGVRVTRSSYRNLSVSHRHSVAVLERIVGPKS